MKDINRYILEKLHLNNDSDFKEIDDDYFLIIYSNKGNMCSKIFDSIADSKNFLKKDDVFYYTGYGHKNINVLKELEKSMHKDNDLMLTDKAQQIIKEYNIKNFFEYLKKKN